jgi:hypothetical protein
MSIFTLRANGDAFGGVVDQTLGLACDCQTPTLQVNALGPFLRTKKLF